MATALIAFASLTGNTEECADLIAEAFESLDVDVTVSDGSQMDPSEFQNYDICVVGSYTYGEGDLPDEIIDFYEDLALEDLSNKVYGVFGSGDTYYDQFCQAVDDFEAQFEKTGALKGAPSVKVNLNAEDDDIENFNRFAKSIVETYNTL